MRNKRSRPAAAALLVLLAVMFCLSTAFHAEGDGVCYHDSTYTSWSGCDWSEYCSSCGALIRSGTTHSYVYTPWEYRTVNSHIRRGTCSVCGATTTASGNHTRKTCYEEHDSAQHGRYLYCTTCYSVIGSVELEDHEFSYGGWTVFSEDLHTRTKSCPHCGYLETEYAAHVFSQPVWTSVSDTEHQCERSCVCGYSITELSEHRDDDGDFFCDDCGKSLARLFSVSVPSSLSLAVSENGAVTAADSACISNNSDGDVTVTGISVSGENGWNIVSYFRNMAGEKVDSRLIGFRLNGSCTKDSDSADTELLELDEGEWNIPRGTSLPLVYDAVVSATSVPVTNEKVLTLCFIVGWAE